MRVILLIDLLVINCFDIVDPYADRPTLRRFLLQGEFFVAASMAGILVKLATRYVQLKGGKLSLFTIFIYLFIIYSFIQLIHVIHMPYVLK